MRDSCFVRAAAGLLAVLCFLTPAAQAASDVVAALYRPDTPYPQFLHLWHEAWAARDAAGQAVPHPAPLLGGYIHVYVRNSAAQAATINDVLLEGVSLKEAIAFSKDEKSGIHPASLFYSKLAQPDIDRLIDTGEPVWWKVDPPVVPAGGFAEITVRLRREPKGPSVRLKAQADNASWDVFVNPREPSPRVMGASCSESLDRLYLYLSGLPGRAAAPGRILIDGKDLTSRANIAFDRNVDVAPVVVQLPTPLQAGSLHLVQADYASGPPAVSVFRASSSEFVYGMWGYSREGNTPEQVAMTFLNDMVRHNVNTLMHSYRSEVADFLLSDAGLEWARKNGLRAMTHAPGNIRKPIYFFLLDEPDAHEYAVNSIRDPNRRLGSLARGLVERSEEFRRKDPVPLHLLNIDNTYKPDNYYTYGQLADVFCSDPYYQEQQKIVWNQRPAWVPSFVRPTYVLAVGTVCQSACAPKPLHLILNCVRHDNPETPFRFGTPEEKRVEVYYSLAAGAKGISYWWYTPYDEFYGCGGKDKDAVAQWTAIGLLGAEVRTAGPVLVRSCPAAVPLKGSKNVWARALLAGGDTLVLLVVNDNHANDRQGTVVVPMEKASLHLTCPSWLSPKDAFEVSFAGVKDVNWKRAEAQVAFDLGKLHLTRMIVVTGDERLRASLDSLYKAKFAGHVAKLSAPATP